MQIREGPARLLASSAVGALRSPMSAMMLAMFTTMASFYVASRLWQDAQNRVYLIKELDRRTGQGQSAISVDDTLKVVACRQQGKGLASLEMELAATKHKGFVGKYTSETNTTNSKKKPLIVMGTMTSFGRKNYRGAVRKSWLPTGTSSGMQPPISPRAGHEWFTSCVHIMPVSFITSTMFYSMTIAKQVLDPQVSTISESKTIYHCLTFKDIRSNNTSTTNPEDYPSTLLMY